MFPQAERRPNGRRTATTEELSTAGEKWLKGVQRDKCFLPFEELCRFRYLINIGGNTYSNRLKFLFLCNSVVIVTPSRPPLDPL